MMRSHVKILHLNSQTLQYNLHLKTNLKAAKNKKKMKNIPPNK